MKKMKRLVALVLCFVMAASLLTMSAAATSIRINKNEFTYRIRQGDEGQFVFTLNDAFLEDYYVNIYMGTEVNPDKLVGSASDEVDSFGTVDLTITWDTSDVPCGVYTLEYYLASYGYDSTSRYTARVEVYFGGVRVINSVLHTDIKAQIDGYPIRSYNIDGNTCIVAEDLMKYGFGVIYDNELRSLMIYDAHGPVTADYQYTPNTHPVGSKAMDVVSTDIRTFIATSDLSDMNAVAAYNVNGMTLIKIDDLVEYGTVSWSQASRTIYFWRY